jgi:hypothetical protein
MQEALECSSCEYSRESGQPCHRVASIILRLSGIKSETEIYNETYEACERILNMKTDEDRRRSSECGIHRGICTGSLA